MKSRLILIIGVFFISYGCSVEKSGGIIKNSEGEDRPHYEQSSPYIRIPMPGDYWFHSGKRKYFIDLDETFLTYATSRLGNKRPLIMYSAHTRVPPYYASLGILYKNINSNDDLIENVRQEIKEKFHVHVDSPRRISTNFGYAIRINYTATNSITKIPICYTEYFINNESNLIRICFWTRDCENEIIKEETEGLVKKIDFNKPS